MATILRHAATGQTLRAGKGWKDENGVQHPPNWNIWSAEEKTAAGVTEIVQESPPDSRLYTWSHNADGTINKTAKALADSGSGDTLRLGVKSNLKETVNGQQGSILINTDWMYIRKVDKDVEIPAHIQIYRDSVRVQGDAMKAAIDGATTTEEMVALFVTYTTNEDGSQTKSGILYDWPELEE